MTPVKKEAVAGRRSIRAKVYTTMAKGKDAKKEVKKPKKDTKGKK